MSHNVPHLSTTLQLKMIYETHQRQRQSRKVVIFVTGTLLLLTWALYSQVPRIISQHSVKLHLQSEELPDESSQGPQSFRLRHVFHHGTGKQHRIHRRLDVTDEFLDQHEATLNAFAQELHTEDEVDVNDADDILRKADWPNSQSGNPWTKELYINQSDKKAKVQRLTERHTPGFVSSYLNYAIDVKGNPDILGRLNLEWDEEEEISIPDIENRDSLVSLALIASNAYVRIPTDDDLKKKSDWTDLGDWDVDEEHPDVNFGWLENGLRGHVFVSNNSKTVVIGIKGTSGAGLPGGGSDETSSNDKTNDNLLFLCCCARVGYMWTTVCDCYEKTYTCNQDCLEKELLRQDRYYQAVLDLYHNVTELYPPEETDIWVTGHSLGGALASLLGRTYGLPAVAFEAPGEMLATKRLHLPQPPGLPRHLEHIWHIGNTADPIFMGVCNGASSSCSVAGYAMETACHTGKLCVYDVIGDKGWHMNLLNHRIHTVIDDIILAYNETAKCVDQPPCKDCFNWRYTSHDNDEPDEPHLPNPLKPHPPKTTSSTTPSPTSSAPTATSTDAPKKCLERTWYGWCRRWEGDDE